MLVVFEVAMLIACIIRIFIQFNFGLSSRNIYIMAISGVAHNFVFIYAVLLAVLLILKLISKKTNQTYTDAKTDTVILVTASMAFVLSLL